jgi:Insect cuticle protein
LVVTLAFIASVSAGALSYVKRSDYNDKIHEVIEPHHHHHVDYYAYPKYKFEYGVHDPHTKDHKSQWEVRDGDVVKGEYTLDEADGTMRKVSYHADSKTGFHAKVEKIGHATHGYAASTGFAGYGSI